jgi:hypothetical protein
MENDEWKMTEARQTFPTPNHYPFSINHYPFAHRAQPPLSGELKMENDEWKMTEVRQTFPTSNHYPFSINHCPFAHRTQPPLSGEWKMIGRARAVSKTRHYPFSINHYPFAHRAELLSQAQLFDQSAIPVEVRPPHILKQFPPLADENLHTAGSGLVLLELVAMDGKPLDTLGQKRDLHL